MRRPKICLIGNNLSSGGADKIHAVLSNYFSRQGIDVHNVIFIDAVTYEFSGELLNLGKDWKGGIFNLFWRFKILSDYLKNNDFDFIIDFRTRHKPFRERIFAKLLSRSKYIPTIHSYETDWYFTPSLSVGKKLFKNAFQIVTVASQIEEKVRSKYGYENVTTILNPIETDKIVALSNEFFNRDYEYILTVGRMSLDDHKQFAKLIGAYSKSNLHQNDVRLLLLGDGPLKPTLEKLVNDEGFDGNVIFEGFVDNPYKYMKNAEFTVLSSKFEGLPNTIAESLACGTPVVSFDCASGPSEFIENRQNGLLVPDQDWKAFIDALNEMHANDELRNDCRANAKASVAKFDIEQIGKVWMRLLNLDQ
ncbi:MAG: glycosyltransferase [Flavobacterium sp.]|uniref:glycosyltransferase n=1 Tax=Flavobacterium sp. TaxID=239 RepID=UPI00120B6AD8|nr:glycosyltransferase [Flavobacterium sp.]RZJ65108.1 MAG: glycosyltransferase [Flavobacterium sp.]